MRVLDFALASALFGSALVLAGCPNKDNAPAATPAAPAATPAATVGASDKAGAEAPAQPAATPAATPAAAAPATPKPKKHDDQGGW